MTIIQIGDNKELEKRLKGVQDEWYYYPGDMNRDELLLEIQDLQDFSKGIIVALEDSMPKKVINFLEKCRFPFEGSEVLVIGRSIELGKMLMDRGCTVILTQGDPWQHIESADLIINIDRRLNCYAIKCPVIDVNGNCYNIENRNVRVIK